MRSLRFSDVVRKLKSAGWRKVSQRGSHVKFAKATQHGTRTVIIPCHREVAPGTLRSILRQAGISPEDFERL